MTTARSFDIRKPSIQALRPVMAIRKTRGTKVATGPEDTTARHVEATLPASSSNPPTLFILPQDRSADARILSLPSPASGKPVRFFFDPKLGIHEFTSIAAPKSAARSWLLAANVETETTHETASPISKGYTIEHPNLFVATPIDPALTMLPVLTAASDASERQLYLTLDDHLERVREYSKDLAEILSVPEMMVRLEMRLKTLCDEVKAGDETMYRINLEKLAEDMLAKANRMCLHGLPASMEQRFVREALQIPATANDIGGADAGADPQESLVGLSQSSDSSTPTSELNMQASRLSSGSINTTATSVDEESPSTAVKPPSGGEIEALLRLQTALGFILASYVQPSLHGKLRLIFKDPKSGVNFSALDSRLAHIETLKREAQALRSLSDNISHKRRSDENDEAEELRAEKRRKKEEEDNRKKAQNRAIKQLAKADTSGMKKLSSFFTKGPAKKAQS